MKQKKSLIVRALCAIGRGLNFFMGRKPRDSFDEGGVVVPLAATYKLTVVGSLPEKATGGTVLRIEKRKPKKKKKPSLVRKYKKTKKKTTSVKLKTKKGRVVRIKAKRGK